MILTDLKRTSDGWEETVSIEWGIGSESVSIIRRSKMKVEFTGGSLSEIRMRNWELPNVTFHVPQFRKKFDTYLSSFGAVTCRNSNVAPGTTSLDSAWPSNGVSKNFVQKFSMHLILLKEISHIISASIIQFGPNRVLWMWNYQNEQRDKFPPEIMFAHHLELPLGPLPRCDTLSALRRRCRRNVPLP